VYLIFPAITVETKADPHKVPRYITQPSYIASSNNQKSLRLIALCSVKYSVTHVTRLRNLGSNPGRGRYLSLLPSTHIGYTQSPVQSAPGAISSGIKRLRREPNKSPSSTAWDKNIFNSPHVFLLQLSTENTDSYEHLNIRCYLKTKLNWNSNMRSINSLRSKDSQAFCGDQSAKSVSG
jgi:hypothetical protein